MTPLGSQAQRTDLIELAGARVALPGIVSTEPILRGCDQRAWFGRLVEAGIRHVLIPLNGANEDTCLFARRHPQSEDDPNATRVLYDLEHRDEGIFARIQFLIETARSAGVLVGFSLFPLDCTEGPLAAEANVQGVGLSLKSATFAVTPRTSKRVTATIKKPASSVERLESVLTPALNWMAAELRGQRGTWVELFSGTDMTALPPLHRELLHVLTVRLARGLFRSAKDLSSPTRGPWLVPPAGLESTALALELFFPFTVWHGKPGAHPRTDGSRSVLCSVPAVSGKGAARVAFRQSLWRQVFKGGWPLACAAAFDPTPSGALTDLAHICRFALQWTGSTPLRPCPEVLDAKLALLWKDGKAEAACDGRGRYFIHFTETLKEGLVLNLLPGTYRYFWYDAATGEGLTRGEGVSGGTMSHVPGLAGVEESILVLEAEEISDPFLTW